MPRPQTRGHSDRHARAQRHHRGFSDVLASQKVPLVSAPPHSSSFPTTHDASLFRFRRRALAPPRSPRRRLQPDDLDGVARHVLRDGNHERTHHDHSYDTLAPFEVAFLQVCRQRLAVGGHPPTRRMSSTWAQKGRSLLHPCAPFCTCARPRILLPSRARVCIPLVRFRDRLGLLVIGGNSIRIQGEHHGLWRLLP